MIFIPLYVAKCMLLVSFKSHNKFKVMHICATGNMLHKFDIINLALETEREKKGSDPMSRYYGRKNYEESTFLN